MTPFDPSKAFQQVREEGRRERQVALERCRRKEEWWAAYRRRAAALNRLMELFPKDTEGVTVDVGRVTALMVEYAQTLSVEWVKSRVAFVSRRLAERAAEGFLDREAGLKEILLNLLLLANAGDVAKVEEVFKEAMRGDPDDVAIFRMCLVNWLVDKVVDGWPPLPDEVKPPAEAPTGPQEVEARSGENVSPTDAGDGNTDRAEPGKERLHFDPQTQTVTLDGNPYKIEDPKAFAVYRKIARSCPQPLTQKMLQKSVRGCRGDKKIRQLLDSLPKPLRLTVPSGPNGYWLDLDPPPHRARRSPRKKSRT
jgi:hypothetical protein